MLTSFHLPRWVDLLFVVALGVYALAGVPIATFHGDEPMQIYMSSDYTTLFIDRAPERLLTQPPYPIDTDPHLRILNGTINRYTIGLAWHLAGFTVTDLPPRPGWDWGLSYADNVATAHRPSDAQMNTARLPSALFFAASIGILFLLTEQVGGRGAAYVAALLYALHPALLLNGRRALQEGSMLFFGLLALYAAVKVSGIRYQVSSDRTEGKGLRTELRSLTSQPKILEPRTQNPEFSTQHSSLITKTSVLSPQSSELLWALLTLACGLTLASKHSGIVFVVGALGGVLIGLRTERKGLSQTFISESIAQESSATSYSALSTQHSAQKTQSSVLSPQSLNWIVRLLRTVVLAFALFYALSPALWNDALARTGDLLAVRSEMLGIQTAVSGGGMTLAQRVEQIAVQPFIAPLAHYEAAPFADAAPIADEIARYIASPLSGVQFGVIGGVLLTLLAVVGIGVCILALWRGIYPHPPTPSPGGAGQRRAWTRHTVSVQGAMVMLVTLAVVLASLLANPLPWQRYYLPLMALITVFAGVGAALLGHVLSGRWAKRLEDSSAPS